MERHNVQRVFIAGGTGFLGYYSVQEFLRQGVQVSTFSLPDIDLDGWFPKEVSVHSGNIFEMQKDELVSILTGFDTMVYSIGPDDRVHSPKGVTAYDFFYERLVKKPSLFFEAARDAGVKKAVLLNSYFAYFDRAFPERELAAHNPYIQVRVEQAEALIRIGGGSESGGMDVVVLELPYIFGAMPKRVPLWKDVFLDRFVNMPAIFFPKGGTSMIHVEGVAHAVTASAYYGRHGDKLPIGKVNEKYSFMINEMMKACGAKKRYAGIPTWLATLGGISVHRALKRQGFSSGLDYRRLMKDIQSKNYYIPEDLTKQIEQDLHYEEFGFTGGENIVRGLQETMQACYPHRFDEHGDLLPKWQGVDPAQAES